MNSPLVFSVRQALVPLVGCDLLFPVRRVYCVGRNYLDHAKEMGGTVSKTHPFFFSKPPDAVVSDLTNHTAAMNIAVKYPPQTADYQHEVELVVAVGGEGRYSALSPEEAQKIIYGYAVGLDMTRRDQQMTAKAEGKPWDLAKGADESAPLSAILPLELLRQQSPSLFYPTDEPHDGANRTGSGTTPCVLRRSNIELCVNGVCRQRGNVSSCITPIDELLSILSHSVGLAPGDLIFTGTPSGVSAVKPGDVIVAAIEGIGELTVRLQ